MDGVTRYRFLSVVGEGGFGRVYRARLEAAGGFHKDVAIKVLTDPDPPKKLLQQFRDEARILGLVRDRAFVGVDPPIQVDGRWAVVMEFVDGMSCGALSKDRPIPPGVAVEIVGEIARALHHAFHMEGPDGQPLHLLHRDIKPENIQITPTGEVKLLDLGIARANFAEREFKTRHSLGGTPGYIAPERLQGQEVPAGDVYSLGVLLHAVITGVRPRYAATVNLGDDGVPTLDPAAENDLMGIPATILVDEPARQVIALAAMMRAEDPTARPTARQVEEVCRTLRMKLPPPFLREWAETEVASRTQIESDERVGRTFTVGTSPVAATVATAPPVTQSLPPPAEDGRRQVALGALLGGGAALVGAGAIVVLLSMVGIAWWSGMLGTPPPEGPSTAASADPPGAAAPDPSSATTDEPPGPDPATPASPAAPPPVGPTAGRVDLLPPAPPVGARTDASKVETKVISVISTTPSATPSPVPAAPLLTGEAPTGKVVVKTIPSGATVKRKGEVLAASGGAYTLAIGTHLLDVTSPSGESTAVPVIVRAGETVSICFNFDTNSACAP